MPYVAVYTDPVYNTTSSLVEDSLNSICRANETQELELLFNWATMNNLGLNWDLSEFALHCRGSQSRLDN